MLQNSKSSPIYLPLQDRVLFVTCRYFKQMWYKHVNIGMMYANFNADVDNFNLRCEHEFRNVNFLVQTDAITLLPLTITHHIKIVYISITI